MSDVSEKSWSWCLLQIETTSDWREEKFSNWKVSFVLVAMMLYVKNTVEETAQKEESAAFSKSNIPLGYTDCSQGKGQPKKKMTTILLQCQQEMRKGKTV